MVRGTLFVKEEGGSRTGIALANPTQFTTHRIVLKLRNEAGEEVETFEIILGAQQHTAQFVSEMFPDLGTFRGSILIEGSEQFLLITLQQTGLVIGTLPVVTALF